MAARAQARERLLRTLIENATEGLALLVGPELRVALVNPAFEALAAGIPLAGRPLGESAPELAQALAEPIEAVRRSRASLKIAKQCLPVRRAAEGMIEEGWFGLVLDRVEEADGTTDVLLHVTDVTDSVLSWQRIAELYEVAQRRAAELESVLETMVDAVLVCDASGAITLVNDAGLRLLGLKSGSAPSLSLSALPQACGVRRPDGRPLGPAELPLARALKGEVVASADLLFGRAGADVSVRSSAAPLKDDRGAILGAVEVARDISQLVEFERLKDEFMRVAAHELKTPVAIAKGYAQALLRAQPELSPAQRKMAEAVNRGSDRIARIVQDLLDVSQLHLDRLDLGRERVRLDELARELVQRASAAAPDHRLTLRAEPVAVGGDRERLSQVLGNLLENAVKYSPAGRAVEVEVRRDGDAAVASVRDNGVGIPGEQQRRIFERFFRAHTGTEYDFGGMGVGLYLSREIIRRHGGTMGFQSVPGQGSTFWFRLPAEQARGPG